MSGKQSKGPGKTFKQKVHWPSVQRRPVRDELAFLRSETLSLPKDLKTDANGKSYTPGAVILRLDEGETAAWRPAKNDKARQKSVDDAQKIVDEVKPVITKLGEAAKQKKTPAIKKLEIPVANEKTEKNSKSLIEQYMALNKKILEAKPELMAVRLPPERDYNALQSKIREIQLKTHDSVIDDEMYSLIGKDFPPLERDFDISLREARAWPSERDKMMEKINGYPKELGPLKTAIEKLGGKPETVAPDLFSTIQLQLRVGGAPADVPGARLAFSEHEKLMAQARSNKPGPYAQELMQKRAASDEVAKEQKKVKDALGAKVHKLRSLCDALGSSPPDVAKDYDTLLAQAGLPDQSGKTPDTGEEIAHLESWIDDAIENETGKLDALRKEAAELHKAVLSEVDKERKANGKNAALKVDWKQIDGIIGAYDQQVAGTDQASAAAVQALIAAKGMDQQIRDRLAAMTDGSGKLKPAFETFEADLKKVQDGLKDDAIAGEKSNFGKHRSDDRTRLETSLKSFVKDLPMLPAAQATQQFAVLKKIYDEKLKEADDLAASIKRGEDLLQDRTGLYATLKSKAKKAKADWKSPNAASIAIAAMKEALKKKPDKIVIDAAYTTLDNAISKTTTYQALISGAQAAVTSKKQAKTGKKDTAQQLAARQRQVAAHIKTTESVVQKADGDMLAIGAINSLMNEAKSKVKAGDKGAEATFANIVARCDMLIAHPEGEANRARGEMPKLYGEWQTLLQNVASEVNATVETIRTYAPDPNSPQANEAIAGVTKLCQQLDDYKTYFTAGGGQLAPHLGKLASDDTPEDGRRKAREAALAIIANQAGALQKNPLSAMLAGCPIGGASAIPGRLNTGLSRLQYTVLTSVRN